MKNLFMMDAFNYYFIFYSRFPNVTYGIFDAPSNIRYFFNCNAYLKKKKKTHKQKYPRV